MKCFEFSAVVTVNREIYVEANIHDVANALDMSEEELDQMSQEELEELFMDKLYDLDAHAILGRKRGISYQEDIVDEQFQDLVVSGEEE